MVLLGEGRGMTLTQLPHRLWLPDIALRQRRVFTAHQARSAGMSRGQVQRRISTGVWVRTVGAGLRRAVDTPDAEMLLNSAALTWPDAVVIGPVAACFHGAPLPLPDRVDVWRGRAGDAPRRGLIPHRIPLDDEWCTSGPARVSTRRRSFVDALAWLPLDEARNFAAWVFTRQHLDHDDLRARLREYPGMHGNGQLRRLLYEMRDGALSVAEQRLIKLLHRAGIRGWTANTQVHDAGGVIGVVDLLFEKARLVIEVDGRAAHADNFQTDRTRQNRLVAAGYTVLRFTWQDVTQTPKQTLETIAGFLRR